MVPAGNMTGPNIDTYYSSVISLRSMHTIIFLAELNDIKIFTGDISNAYLTACTTEKIVFDSIPYFSPSVHVVHLLLIKNALYGLKTSGARFHSLLSDYLTALCFVPYTGGFDI